MSVQRSDKEMNKQRFHCKTKHTGITTIIGIVVMLLLFSTFSCSKEKKEIVEVAFNPETTYTMLTEGVSTLMSDSGVTRYRLNTETWLTYDKAEEPYYYFPNGLYIERFDTLFNPEATIKADTGYYWTKKGLYKLINNVEIKNLEGERFETSLLYWDQEAERVWSDQFIRITRDDKVITGIGFESNQTMTNYQIFNSAGEFTVEDTDPVDSAQAEDITE